jgi:AcrR family transcriptional regulator
MGTLSTSSARQRILDTAHNLFYQQGVRATGVDQIIALAGVTKVTFYRHFPSKRDLVLAFLKYRHERWIAWFQEALERNGGDANALVPALAAWFKSDDYRGCAFINTVGEFGQEDAEIIEITRAHKRSMQEVIEKLLPETADHEGLATTIAVALDGAIVRAQYEEPSVALVALAKIVEALTCQLPR